MCVYICITESLCSPLETSMTLEISHTSVKKDPQKRYDKDRHIDQCNRIEGPEIDFHVHEGHT